jgi:hypothetical protein
VPLTREQRSIRASIAACTRWSKEDPAVNAARGQAGLLARFEREVREAEPGLSEAEYARRAESAYRAHMARLALASSKARGRNGGSDAARQAKRPARQHGPPPAAANDYRHHNRGEGRRAMLQLAHHSRLRMLPGRGLPAE